ncbi:MAG: hypothetical protein AAF170_18785 [Bacteroidota bacterium]
MKVLLPALLLLFVWGCDSDDPTTASLEGRYTGGDAASFSTPSGTVFITYDIDLDIDPPGQSGTFMGDATLERGPVENASALTGRGTVSGTLSGSNVTFSATASNFVSRHATSHERGGGLRLDAEGTLTSDGALLLEATILDFAYGRSEPFNLALQK